MQVRNSSPQSPQVAPAIIPKSTEFRAWVQDCLGVLDVSARSLAVSVEMGPNTLRTFLSDPTRGINMDTANVLTCKLHEAAHDQGKVLPRLGAIRLARSKGVQDNV
ncbi:hypothetical protein [Epibacterium sp. Ofav1-8]|uniref:hypothetical protein n=1 Tax=Epibacterium sp. Ofav1-8 TaxID=2917735 RepID=UPI001EF6BE9B|nr:hypothetical protein [Epibacterium sp. Ofav1-8]MCG7626032.1 hypothetical protein [Epibacterium sp. Ofav1-8]